MRQLRELVERFRLVYSRTFYGTGYYIYHLYDTSANLSQPIRAWDGKTTPDVDVLDLLRNAGTDIAPQPDTATGTKAGLEQRTGKLDLLADQAVAGLDDAPAMIRALTFSLPRDQAISFVAGIEHSGTSAGKVFNEPPPPPAAYQRGKQNPSGLGEQLLRAGPNGAVAYIGCNTGSQPCGLTLLEGFAKTWADSEVSRLGDCWNGAVEHYYDHERLAQLKPTASWSPPSIFFQGMKFMVFGDPALRLPK